MKTLNLGKQNMPIPCAKDRAFHFDNCFVLRSTVFKNIASQVLRIFSSFKILTGYSPVRVGCLEP